MNRFPSIQILLAALLCSLIGCDGNPSPPPADSAKTPVSLQLNWMPEAEHGGYYAALIHGFYAQEGLDVTIHPGGPGVPKIQNVAVGRMDFAIANADEVLIARSRDADVVALLAPLQSTPRCILVHRESGIRTLAELRNVTLSMSDGRAWARHLKSKVSLDGVQIVPYSSVAQFVARKGYAIQGYAFSEPFVARNAGSDPVVLMTAELGFNPYTSMLITREDRLHNQPDLAERMVRASLRGWRHYLQNPEKVNEHLHQKNPEMSLEALAFGARALRPLCLPGGLPPESVGRMTLSRWNELAAQLVALGMIEADTDPAVAFRPLSR